MIGKIGIYFVANVYCGLLALAVIPFMSRLLGPEDLGRAVMFVTLVWVLNTTIGLNLGAIYTINRKQMADDPMRQLTTSAVTLAVVNSLAAAAIVTLAAPALTAVTGLPLPILLLAVVGSLFNLMFLLLQAEQMIAGRSKTYAVQQIANATAIAALTVALLKLGGASLDDRVMALCIPYVAFGAYAAIVMLRAGTFSARPRFAEAPEVWRTGLGLMPHMAGVFLFAGIDRFVATDLAGARAAGVYLGTVAIAASFSFVITAINRAVVPTMYDKLGRDLAEARRFMRRMLFIGLGATALIFAAAWVAAPLAQWFLGAQYAGAAELFPWLLLSQALFGLYTVGANVLLYYKRTLTLSAVTLSAGTLGLGLMYLFYPLVGLLGLTLALTVAFVFRSALTVAIGFALVRRPPERPAGAVIEDPVG